MDDRGVPLQVLVSARRTYRILATVTAIALVVGVYAVVLAALIGHFVIWIFVLREIDRDIREARAVELDDSQAHE